MVFIVFVEYGDVGEKLLISSAVFKLDGGNLLCWNAGKIQDLYDDVSFLELVQQKLGVLILMRVNGSTLRE